MNDTVIQIITVVIGAVGIGIYFNVEKSKIPAITIGALISWITYLIVMKYTDLIFAGCMISSIVVSIYSEISARILKCPSNMFLVPSVVTLLPGGSFYYMMDALVNLDSKVFKEKAYETIMTVLGISMGVVIGFFIFIVVFNKVNRVKNTYLS